MRQGLPIHERPATGSRAAGHGDASALVLLDCDAEAAQSGPLRRQTRSLAWSPRRKRSRSCGWAIVPLCRCCSMTKRSTGRSMPDRGARPKPAPPSRPSSVTRSGHIRAPSSSGPTPSMISRASPMRRFAAPTWALPAWHGRSISWPGTGWPHSYPIWPHWPTAFRKGFGERRSWSPSRRLRRRRCCSERAAFCLRSRRSARTAST